MPRRRSAALLALFVFAGLGACGARRRAIVPPELVLTRIPDVSDAAASLDGGAEVAPSPAEAAPVRAALVEVLPSGTEIPFDACETIAVALVQGDAEALGERLFAGDLLLVAARPLGFTIAGRGLAVVAHLAAAPCAGAPQIVTRVGASSSRAPGAVVVRANATPDHAWADGAMHAWILADADRSPTTSIVRLVAAAPIALHTHAASWEVVAVVGGGGTFAVDGAAEHVARGAVVAIPPGASHAFAPDPGTKIDAIEFFAPPGPEQRYEALGQ